MILILGGTRESRKLAETLERPFTLSLAGATKSPLMQEYPVRTGGFGGVKGLQSYIQHHGITAIIDATHPFAARISTNAVQAAAAMDIPLLRFERPAWPLREDWQTVATIADAAKALPVNARAFLTLGSQRLADFGGRRDIWCLTRAIEPPEHPPYGSVLLQRPPFTVDGETTLMQKYGITHLVSKNAGGRQTMAKLDAAEKLGVRVIMVNRPELPLAETTQNLQTVLDWIRQNAGR